MLGPRVGVTRVTQRTAVSWTLLVMVAVKRGTLAVTTRWLVVFLPFWVSLTLTLLITFTHATMSSRRK